MNSNEFALRRTIQPYLGEIVIFGALSLLLILAWLKTANLSWLEAIVVMLGVAIATHYADIRYRVSWKAGQIECITSNNIKIRLKPSDISRVVLETSDLKTILRLTRPARRIAIYSKNQEHIDVSLKHFVTGDINRLMQEIHKERPDLSIPTIH